jgi:hypothetical protein
VQLALSRGNTSQVAAGHRGSRIGWTQRPFFSFCQLIGHKVPGLAAEWGGRGQKKYHFENQAAAPQSDRSILPRPELGAGSVSILLLETRGSCVRQSHLPASDNGENIGGQRSSSAYPNGAVCKATQVGRSPRNLDIVASGIAKVQEMQKDGSGMTPVVCSLGGALTAAEQALTTQTIP